LNISGGPNFSSASSSASVQNETSRVLERRQAITRRENQSMIAVKLAETPGHGQIGYIRRPYVVCVRDLLVPEQVGIDFMRRVRL